MKTIRKLFLSLSVVFIVSICLIFSASAENETHSSNVTYKIYPELELMIFSGEGEIKDDYFGLREESQKYEDPAFEQDYSSAVWQIGIKYVKTVIIQEGITRIGANAFGSDVVGFGYLENVILPESLKEIGNGAFYGCHNLKTVCIPSGAEKIGEEAFYGCTKLKSVNIPSETQVGNNAFDCTDLTSLSYMNNETDCFEHMDSLKKHTTSSNSGYICQCNALEEVIIDSKNNNSDYQDIWKFRYCKELKTVRILSMTDVFRIEIEECPNVKIICYRGAKIIKQLEEDRIPYEVISAPVKSLGEVKNIKSGYYDGYKVSWDAVENAGFYRLELYNPEKKEYELVYSGSKTSAIIKAHYDAENKLRIRACAYDGESYVYGKDVNYNTYYLSHISSFKAVFSEEKSVKLTWKADDKATGYQVYWSADGKTYKKIANVKGISYTKSNLKEGKTYYFKARAYRKLSDGKYTYGGFSNVFEMFVSGFKATSSVKQKVNFSWKAMDKATGYQIYYSTDGKDYKKLATTKKTSYAKTGLTSGKTYYFKVRAYKKVGGKTVYGSFSSAKSVKIK